MGHTEHLDGAYDDPQENVESLGDKTNSDYTRVILNNASSPGGHLHETTFI